MKFVIVIKMIEDFAHTSFKKIHFVSLAKFLHKQNNYYLVGIISVDALSTHMHLLTLYMPIINFILH